MKYAEAHEAARALCTEWTCTCYLIAHPEREGLEFCTLPDWIGLHAQGWRYVEMVTEESVSLHGKQAHTCVVCGGVLAADERDMCDHHVREEVVHGYGRDAE